MIIILKRDDLPNKYQDQPVEDVQLDQLELSSDLIEQAELIVFVDGRDIRFIKHFPEMQSKNSLDVLMSYITGTGPTTNDHLRSKVKRFPRRKKKQ